MYPARITFEQLCIEEMEFCQMPMLSTYGQHAINFIWKTVTA